MKSINNQRLFSEFKRKLVEEKLIACTDTIKIQAIHPLKQNGEILHHYIISVESKETKYFIRTIKEKDNSCMVTEHLTSLCNNSNCFEFPYALTSPFAIDNHFFIITNYLEGKDLEMQMQVLTNDELVKIADELNEKLGLIHSITHDKYSFAGGFVDGTFGDIFFQKIREQFNNKYNVFASNIDVNEFLSKVNIILQQASFSRPTLIHMDIKPSNIIISSTGNAQLIDFELSRFADLDYEWTNILIKSIHAYDERFKQYVLAPIIDKNFMPIERALLIDKYKVYLLYLAVNKYLYCFKHEITCPAPIVDLANMIVHQII